MGNHYLLCQNYATDSVDFSPSHPDSTALLVLADSNRITKIDTIYTIDSSFTTKATFSAKDSLYADIKNEKLFLYGDAKLQYEDISMTANYMEVNMKTHEIFASYTYDADSNKVGIPHVDMDGEEMEMGKIKMNYVTKKAFIREVKIKQDENYLYMDVAKRQANEDIHFRKGRFTTCDLPEPHYHFQLSRAILIPDKRIVSGPMNIWIKNVPTPLGLPFVVIPQSKERKAKHGLLFPQFIPQSAYGMGVQNLGYYIPINDTVQTTMYGSIFSRGSWDVSNRTNYKVRYKFSGQTYILFQQMKQPFPSKSKNNKLEVQWQHRQDPKANPYWNFNANVNFISDNRSKNNLDPLNSNYFNNSFNSDINLTRSFPGKPVNMGLKVAVNQNSSSHNVMLTAPTFSTNVTRFYPFKFLRKSKIGGTKWYERIGMTYNLEVKNRSTFGDSLLQRGQFQQIGASFYNGISQNATLQTTLSLLKNIVKLTPSVTYRNLLNFQQIRKNYDGVTSSILYDTLQKLGMSQQFTANVQMTTVLYSYYKFVGKSKPLLRHIMTPSVSYQFIPMLDKRYSYYDNLSQEVFYSPYERSLYNVAATRNQSLINFSLNNTFELKRKSDKDTLTGFKKTRIIDALALSGSYDMLRDSMKLSDINLDLRISPVNFLSFTSRAVFSAYSWNDSTGRRMKEFALTDRHVLGRITYVEFNTTFTIASKQSKEKIKENGDLFGQYWDSDFRYYALHPEMFLDFTIPWKINLSHSFSVRANENISLLENRKYVPTHTIMLNGDINLTKRWKIAATAYYDIGNKKLTNLRVDLTRDMHCWQMSVNWIPIGFNKSFMVTIMGTSSMLSSAKINLRKPPALMF